MVLKAQSFQTEQQHLAIEANYMENLGALMDEQDEIKQMYKAQDLRACGAKIRCLEIELLETKRSYKAKILCDLLFVWTMDLGGWSQEAEGSRIATEEAVLMGMHLCGHDII
ncbi:hypothetical protein AAFF_G00292290 [Aldrovandia affinis]|uniref:Uncharacterized protein n=1 Tax=Aldrovandia affinis TaxID=143900 RepID=A0AAD7SRI7_9TELE|nr:hypothetical protein AAFF_G00292290 [Aldrovandia affinis]